MIYVARVFAPHVAGDYAVMMVVLPLVEVLVAGGFTQAAARRLAGGAPGWVPGVTARHVAGLRLAVGVGLVIVWEATIRVFPLPRSLIVFLRLSEPAWIAIALDPDWLFVALARMDLAAAARAVNALGRLALIVFLVPPGGEPTRIPLAVSAAGGLATALGWLLAARTLPRRDLPRASDSRRDPLDAREARQFLLGDLAVYSFTQADRFVVYALAGPEVTGLYHAAQRLVNPFYSISTVVTAALYRSLAIGWTAGRATLEEAVRRYHHWMLIATVPVGPFALLFSRELVRIAYGPAYAAAAPMLAILGWTITFGYANGALILPFKAWGLSGAFSRTVTAAGLVGLGGCLVLVPRLGGVGAALAALGASLTATGAGLAAFRSAVRLPLAGNFGRPALASVAAFLAGGVGQALLGGVAGALLFTVAYLATHRALARLIPAASPGETGLV